ncbi:MAG: hypothetical protein AAF578_10365 [Pseudomonadota bacterium]
MSDAIARGLSALDPVASVFLTQFADARVDSSQSLFSGAASVLLSLTEEDALEAWDAVRQQRPPVREDGESLTGLMFGGVEWSGRYVPGNQIELVFEHLNDDYVWHPETSPGSQITRIMIDVETREVTNVEAMQAIELLVPHAPDEAFRAAVSYARAWSDGEIEVAARQWHSEIIDRIGGAANLSQVIESFSSDASEQRHLTESVKLYEPIPISVENSNEYSEIVVVPIKTVIRNFPENLESDTILIVAREPGTDDLRILDSSCWGLAEVAKVFPGARTDLVERDFHSGNPIVIVR